MDRTPIGYLNLIKRLNLNVIPHYRSSFLIHGKRQTLEEEGVEIHLYPPSYSVGDDFFGHIEFALKHEGLNLEILREVFARLDAREVSSHIANQPTGRYARIVWYLYENLIGPLDLPDLDKGSYCDLLDEKKYYTTEPTSSRRHRIRDNLLGNFDFCPFVRKTDRLQEFENKQLASVAMRLIKRYEPAVIARAMHYLYSKETMSSYEIERERPNKKRSARFIELLKKAEDLDGLSKEGLIRLQQTIVDPRFASDDYRDFQNYVGEEARPGQQTIHYICPKSEDVPSLMQGLLESEKRVRASSAVIAAAAIAFGFVLIHPFEDGNGRIHRFLIHHILAKMNFTPPGTIFPVSAVMLRERGHYDKVLESFSTPLLSAVKDYEIDRQGQMQVKGVTRQHYFAIDCTKMAEFTYECVEKTIHTDFKEELDYLVHYDRVKSEIQEIVDMPDQKIDLLIKCMLQNKGKLSLKKREHEFNMLTNDEVSAIEAALRAAFHDNE